MRIVDLILKKRDGKELNDEEIHYFIDNLVDGGIEGSQLGAMLMAWFLNGMSGRELAVLTHSMTYSGETLTWPEEWKPILVDKHSTGGVGDKVSLVLAPALAACGLKVPMISGRGLGFTGGTLDKLESIPGFTVSLTLEEMTRCLSECGCCIAGQTAKLVPADRIMYATRDITGTVDNANFVTASIISKKAAENISALILDVKVGKASFSKSTETARFLANSLVKAAQDQGIHTTAVLTSMDYPIGKMIGNSLEVAESVMTLRGKGPSDLVELVTVQGGLLLKMIGKAESSNQGQEMILKTLTDGSALATFEKMLKNQNVNAEVAHKLCYGDMDQVLQKAKYSTPVIASCSGYIVNMDALAIAEVCGALGAARAKASDILRLSVGIQLLLVVGQEVVEGQTWAVLNHECEHVPTDLWLKLQDAIKIEGELLNETPSTRIREIIN